jgi:ATP-dependent Clp protease ATP-binding subunit ClpC
MLNATKARIFSRAMGQPVRKSCIETEHLLLGLLREDKALANRFLRSAPP